MTSDPGAVPQQRGPLFAAPGTGDGTGRRALLPAPVPESSTEDCPESGAAVPAVASTPVPMTLAERASTAVRYRAGEAARVAREAWAPIARFLQAVAHPEPETMREHWTHIQSRDWVPEEMTGGPEKVIAAVGLSYHLVVAYPLKAAAKSARFASEKLDAAADRPLQLLYLLVPVLILVLLFTL
jgi:hypothetical protein